MKIIKLRNQTKMRSITILLVLLICAVSTDLQAQKKPKVAAAMKAMKSDDFSTAIAEINRASEYEKLKDDPKTWWSRAQIFMKADTSGAGVENALEEAIASLDKANELSNGDVSKLFVTDAYGVPVPFDKYKNNYSADYINKGSTAYGELEYLTAIT